MVDLKDRRITMTQEEKELLLQDLCCRLPYGVKIQRGVNYKPMQLWSVGILELGIFNRAYYNNGLNNDSYSVMEIKPYLRPLSSMTEAEKEEFKKLTDCDDVTETGFGYVEGGTLEDYISTLPFKLLGVVTKWLLSHHFDYMGLIDKGLALEAPKDMYNV